MSILSGGRKRRAHRNLAPRLWLAAAAIGGFVIAAYLSRYL